jgi:predicted peptidase
VSVASAWILALAGSVAANVDTGFLDRTVDVAGKSYAYQVYVPRDYAADKEWPVILFLHGAGERGDDGLLQTVVGLAPAIRREPARYPAIVVFPQAPPNEVWVGAPARAAMAALDRTLEEFRTDRRRVYLTGLSMGGHGTWYLAYRHTERFAAIVPVCGYVDERVTAPDRIPLAPPAATPVQAAALKLAKTPIWIFHGERDGAVPVSGSREIAAALEAIKANVHYSELPGVDHNSWDAAYASNELTNWLFAQRRP